MKDNLLEVGDVVYVCARWGGWNQHKINKVTPKRATAGHIELHREVKTENHFGEERKVVRIVGEYGTAKLPTPEIEKEYKEEQLTLKAKRLSQNLNVTLLTIDQIKQLVTLLESFKQKDNATL